MTDFHHGKTYAQLTLTLIFFIGTIKSLERKVNYL